MPQSYYDWTNTTQTCPACAWMGKGCDAEVRESFAEGAEYQCPKCSHYFGFIAYPLTVETATDPRASVADRMIADLVLSRSVQSAEFPSRPAESWPSEFREHIEQLQGILEAQTLTLRAIVSSQPLVATQLRAHVSHWQATDQSDRLSVTQRDALFRTLLRIASERPGVKPD